MIKRQCQSDPDSFVYLDDRGRRVIATATLMPSGGFAVYGPQDTVLRAGSEQEADQIAERFAFAL